MSTQIPRDNQSPNTPCTYSPTTTHTSHHYQIPCQPPPNLITNDNLDQNSEHYGDVMHHKRPKHIRIVLQNLHFLPQHSDHSKSTQLFNFIEQANVDALLGSEINLNLGKIHQKHLIRERCVKARLNLPNSIAAYNTNERSTTTTQMGGTLIVTTKELTCRISQKGRDNTNLGRWSWINIRGRADSNLRVISAYRPHTTGSGTNTIVDQQERYWREQQSNKTPRQHFDKDITTTIEGWINQGDQVILGIDQNEHVLNSQFSQKLRQIGLREVITDQHKHTEYPPATYARGENPIDGIWCTAGIQPSKCGYTPFYTNYSSDHRMLWIDIPIQDALGHNPPGIHDVTPRRLQPQDPRNVKKYIKLTLEGFKKHQIMDKLKDLKQHVEKNSDLRTIKHKYDTLSNLNRQIRFDAAKKTRKIHTGAIPYSPELKKYLEIKTVWELMLKRRKRVKVSMRKIKRLAKRHNIMNALSSTKQQIELQVKVSNIAYFKFKKQEAQINRKAHLRPLAEAKAKENQTDPENELQKLLHQEHQRKSARMIRACLKKGKKFKTVTMYSSHTGTRKECVTRLEMEQATMIENETRFTHSLRTPFMQEPLISALGTKADTPAGNRILQGNYDIPPGVDPYAQKLIRALKQHPIPPNINPISRTISVNEHIKAWRKQKIKGCEETELDMAHLKAGTYHDDIASLDAEMRNIPYSLGFSPKAYKIITDVTIPKKENVPDVEKNRTIMKFNASFNMNLKKLGRDTSKFAEETQRFAKEQFGSRKGHQANNAGLCKTLFFNILHQQRLPGSLLSNDARQCYDRMSHNVVALSMRRLGAPKEAVNSMLETLQDADHYVQTGYGRSSTTYGGSKRKARGLLPMAGKGQGSGDAPTAFLTFVLPMIESMKHQGYGAFLKTAITHTLLHILSIMFVDDGDNLNTAHGAHHTGEQVVQKTQESADEWHGLLRAGGGALAADKSFWYMIDFKFSTTTCRWNFKSKEDLPGDITFLEEDGSRSTIARYEPHEAQKTLGIYIAPDGNMQEEIRYLREKAEAFATNIKRGSIDRNTAWQAMNTTILRTMEYPMPTTTIRKKKWEYIMAPILNSVLPKSGLASNFARALVYGQSDLQGLGVMHPWHQQRLTHVKTFLVECSKPSSVTRSLMLISIENMKLETGLPGSLFRQPYHLTQTYTTEGWIKQLWETTRSMQIVFDEPTPNLTTSRENDQFLMQCFIEHGYKGLDLRILNCCRSKLQAITTADIATGAGTHLSTQAIKGESSTPWQRFNWPRNPDTIPPKYWKIWEAALKTSLCNNDPNFRLATPLGNSTRRPENQWEWYRTQDSQILYRYTDAGYQQYRTSRITPRIGTNFRKTNLTVPILPPDAIQATAESITEQIASFTGTIHREEETQSNQNATATEDLQDRIHPADKWAVDAIIETSNLNRIAESIINGTARQISDGSYKDQKGTSAFTITADDPTFCITGVNTVPGEEEIQSSFRSELAGIAGGLVTLQAICETYDIQEGRITIGLDGEEALNVIKREWEPLPTDTDYDIITDIRAKAARLPLTLKWIWIKGHQDKNQSQFMLDSWAKDNIKMDRLAKAHWKRKAKSPTRIIVFRDERMPVMFQDEKISHFDMRKIYNALTAMETLEYWEKKHKIPRHVSTAIDWQTCGLAYRGLTLGKQRRITKHASGNCGTGLILQQRGYQAHSNCPLCDAEDEDTIHLLRCRDHRAKTQWNLETRRLTTWMHEQKTSPDILRIIKTALEDWRDDRPTRPPLHRLPAKVRLAVEEQYAIGWYQFLLGRISHVFIDAQASHYAKIQCQKSAQTWATSLIRQVWKITWSMWDNRNEILHNKTTPQKRREKEYLMAQVEDQFALGPEGLLNNDRAKLRDKNKIKNLDIPEMRLWIKSMELARDTVARQEEQQARALARQQQIMQNFFIPNQNNQ